MTDPAVAFAARLRLAGLSVSLDCVITFARALDAVGLDRRGPVYWAGRGALMHRPEDAPAYDAAFAEFWEGRGTWAKPADDVVLRVLDNGDTSGDEDSLVNGEPNEGVLRWSAAEVLSHKNLASCTVEELDEAARLIGSMRLSGPVRRSRRRRPSRHRYELDFRRTIARSLRAGGESTPLSWQAPGVRRRRVVLLVDVSGSMAPYSRALLRFAHVAVASRRPVEVFALGTRLTRLTPALRTHDADAALLATTAAVADFEGGTRLGETVGEFADRWGVCGMARGAIVVVLSDGWDRGDPALLGEQMARLSRVAHRVIWANPLKASLGYEPLVGGMAAALPWIDEFVEGHTVVALEHLAKLIAA